MKKFLLPFVTFLLGAALALLIAPSLQSQPTSGVLGEETSRKKSIKVGAILPLSGDLSFVGHEMRRGMELALADVPDAHIQIVYEDDQSLANTASVNAVNKLVNVDKVTLVFNSVVDTIKAIAPVLNADKIPGIVIWDNNKTIASLGEYVFGMGFSTELAGEDMATFAYEKLGLRHMSVVSAFNDWSEVIVPAFIKKFQSLGGIIDIHERVSLSESDLRTIVVKINSKQSQGVYFPIYLQSLNSLVKQARDAGYRGQFMTGDAFTSADIEALGKYVEGTYATNLWLEDQTFLKTYKQKYGEDAPPINLAFAGLGYDAIKLVAELDQHLKSRKLDINSQTVRDNLVGFQFEGITGKTVFSPERITDKREMILIVKNGKFELAEK